MRRKRHSNPSNGGLLLDTLSNALGSVLFIALLVVILSKNAPVLTDAIGASMVPPVAALEALSQLPASEQLEKRLAAVRSNLAPYEKSGLTPALTTQRMATLTAQRNSLQNKLSHATLIKPKFKEVKPKASSYGIAKMVQNELTHIVIFKDGKLFLSGLELQDIGDTGGLTLSKESTAKGGSLVTISPIKPSDHKFAVRRLSLEVSTDSRVFYYVYPSGYELYAQVQAGLTPAGESILIPVPENEAATYSETLGFGGFAN